MQYLKVWTSFRDIIKPLSDVEKGRLFDMMLNYTDTGEEPAEFAGNERFVWPAAKQSIDLTASKAETLRQNGLKGGRPVSKDNQSEANESKNNQSKANKSLNNNSNNNCNSNNNKKDITDRFERFWKEYPRHVAKQDAFKKFEKLNPDDQLLEVMIKAVEQQKKSEQWTKDGGQFIPHPATWINQKRWEDEAPVAVVKVLPSQNFPQRNYSSVDDDLMASLAREMEAFQKGAG